MPMLDSSYALSGLCLSVLPLLPKISNGFYRGSTRNLLALMTEFDKDKFYSIVLSLRESFNEDVYENHHNRYNCIYKVIRECSTNMSYPDFHRAWNDNPKSFHPEVEDNSHTDDIETVNRLNNRISDP
jgi:hypothetical protein